MGRRRARQIALAVVTALLVLAIGRHLASVRIGVIAALVATLHPYLVWHDVHVNREIVDGVLLAALVLLVLLAHDRRSTWLAAAAGAVAGLAILSNARLLLLPVVVAPFVAWRFRPGRRAVVAGVLVVVASAPSSPRGSPEPRDDRLRDDHDRHARALEGEQPRDVRRARPRRLDRRRARPAGRPALAREGGVDLRRGREGRRRVRPGVVLPGRGLDFWRDEPGEKARLAVQAVGMLWSPFLSVDADDPGQQGLADLAQRTVEPAFVLVLYALALWGAFLAPRRFVALTAMLLAYNTLAAMVFAGTVRYRAPWDFLLALLAAFALERAWELLRERRRPVAPSAVR